MRTRQLIITMDDLAMLGSGVMVMQFLRAHGLNPEGKIERYIDPSTNSMVYTERLDDEEPKAAGKVSTVGGGVRDKSGAVSLERPEKHLWL